MALELDHIGFFHIRQKIGNPFKPQSGSPADGPDGCKTGEDGLADQLFMIFPFQNVIQNRLKPRLFPLAAINIASGQKFNLFSNHPAQRFGFKCFFRSRQFQGKKFWIEFPLNLDVIDYRRGNIDKPLGFGGGKPCHVEPTLTDAGEFQQFLGHEDLFFSLNITFQVMAVAEVSAGHQNPVTPAF